MSVKAVTKRIWWVTRMDVADLSKGVHGGYSRPREYVYGHGCAGVRAGKDWESSAGTNWCGMWRFIMSTTLLLVRCPFAKCISGREDLANISI